MRLTPLEPWIAQKVGLSPGERLTRAAIEAYQLQKLGETLRLVQEKSLFYRTHLRKAPSHLTSLEDLQAFPFTTAEDLKSDPYKFVCCSQNEISRIVTLPTSGTTGLPKRLFFTEDDQELTIDFFQAGMSTLVGEGDRVLILLPGERPGSVGDLLVKALPRIGAQGIPHGAVNDVRETLDVIAAQDINAIVGTPVQVLALARHTRSIPHYHSIRLKSVLLSTDHASQAIRRALYETWGCEVFDHLGMTEMGLGGGVECEARRGYHVREADMFFEIVDPLSGQVLDEGETGEVVFTTLTRRGMPLIRYRTGDLGRFIPGECPCGTVLKTLATVRSRVAGVFKTVWGDFCLADLDEVLFSLDGVLDFSASLSHSPGRTILDVEVWWVDENQAKAAEIERVLKKITPLKNASDAGELEIRIKIRMSEPEYPHIGPLSKRTIHVEK